MFRIDPQPSRKALPDPLSSKAGYKSCLRATARLRMALGQGVALGLECRDYLALEGRTSRSWSLGHTLSRAGCHSNQYTITFVS